MAKGPKSSYCDQPDQFTLFDRLRKRRKSSKATVAPVEPPAPIIVAPTPTQQIVREGFLRRAMSSGIEVTGDIVKEGARDAAVSGVKWAIAVTAAATGFGGYMWHTTSATPPPPPPSQIETGALPAKPVQNIAPPTSNTMPQTVVSPRAKMRSAPSKAAGKKTTTRIFILEDIVDWLKQSPGQ